MKYINRTIEKTIKKALKQSKVVLITGARQVGKTTTVKRLKGFNYITLDDDNELLKLSEDKNLFFADKKLPIIIDEAQYSKDIFRYIKKIVDENNKKGQVILTGSQSYELMAKSSESLAGRITILNMPNFSIREISGIDDDRMFIPNDNYIKKCGKRKKINDIWKYIYKGFAPMVQDKNTDVKWFYTDYVNTYIERDVRKIINIENETDFKKFLISVVARSGQVLVYEDIAKDIGVSSITIKKWCSVLANSGIIKIVNTYSSNYLKRIIKSPKLYVLDTGLMCNIMRWPNKETIQNGPMAGQIFETFVFSEIYKSFVNIKESVDDIYYYRDKDKNEIDLIIEQGDNIYPIEIKLAATVNMNLLKSFNVLKNIKGKKICKPTVICMVNKPYIFNNIQFLPISYL